MLARRGARSLAVVVDGTFVAFAALVALGTAGSTGCGMYTGLGTSLTRGGLGMEGPGGEVAELDGTASLDHRTWEAGGFTGLRNVRLTGGMSASYSRVAARTGAQLEGSSTGRLAWTVGLGVGPLVAGVSPYVQAGFPLLASPIVDRPLVERHLEAGAEVCTPSAWLTRGSRRSRREDLGASGVCVRLAVAFDRGDPRDLGDEITTATHYDARGVLISVVSRVDLRALFR